MKRIYLGLIFLLSSCSSTQQSTQVVPETDCGVERWSVKNLLDADTSKIDFNSKLSSLAEIVAMPRTSAGMTTPRLDVEKQTVTITATVTEMKREDDGDIHLLLVDINGNHMIAEMPDPDKCSELKYSSHADAWRSNLVWLNATLGTPTTNFKTVGKTVYIRGVLFQDFSHGQKSEAPNSMEIHPVLQIQ